MPVIVPTSAIVRHEYEKIGPEFWFEMSLLLNSHVKISVFIKVLEIPSLSVN